MATFQKIDLYTDDQLAAVTTKEGDTISVTITGADSPTVWTVTAVEIDKDSLVNPDTKQSLSRIVVTLSDD